MEGFEEYRREQWKLLANEDKEPPFFPFKINRTIEEVEKVYSTHKFRLIKSFSDLKKEKPQQLPYNGSFGVRRQLGFPICKNEVVNLSLDKKIEIIFRKCPGWIYDDEISFFVDLAESYSSLCSHIVELGSFLGKSANLFAFILHQSNVKIHCIDKWAISSTDLFKADSDLLYAIHFDQFLKWTYWFKENLNIIRWNSWKAAKFFDDNSVDIVFVDAGHDYDNVTKDIINWLPKIRKGGVMVGHDYCDAHPDVITAVHHIFGNNFERGPGRIWYKIIA